MKELWTVQFEVEVEQGDNYLWDHVRGKPHFEIYNGDDGLRELFEDGIHWHSHMICTKEFDWKLIKREPFTLQEKSKT